jgi:hypothetical protein
MATLAQFAMSLNLVVAITTVETVLKNAVCMDTTIGAMMLSRVTHLTRRKKYGKIGALWKTNSS